MKKRLENKRGFVDLAKLFMGWVEDQENGPWFLSDLIHAGIWVVVVFILTVTWLVTKSGLAL